jgi:hypothetical protein
VTHYCAVKEVDQEQVPAKCAMEAVALDGIERPEW